MKKTETVFLILFLTRICFSDLLILPENVDSVVVEPSWRGYERIADNDRLKLKLSKNKIKQFIHVINKSELILDPELHRIMSEGTHCYEIKIYGMGKLLITIPTDGVRFYYEKNKSSYATKDTENLFNYWKEHKWYVVLLEENGCI